MRVLGIDPGTVTVDLCGLDDGAVFVDESFPTADILRDSSRLLALIEDLGPLDLVAGPSGYGLPLVAARDLTETDIRLACLAPPGEPGGIGGLGALLRALSRSTAPVLLTPGVVHLPSVPAHRKANRVDMGTADKVCATALAIDDQARRRGCGVEQVSLVLLELGGAFTSAIAVRDGRIVDGLGGTSGPPGLRAAGALDGEVAYLAGEVTKAALFTGGAASIAGEPGASAAALAELDTARARTARAAWVEGAVKAAAVCAVSSPRPFEIVLSGRAAGIAALAEALIEGLGTAVPGVPVRVLEKLAPVSTHAAQGAALVADGLAGGSRAALVERLALREASGTVLDHLYLIDRAAARRRIGIHDA